MSAGLRSLASPWLGGASAPAPAAGGPGYRGCFGLWLGGACARPAPPPPAGGPGYRSCAALWLGGACARPGSGPPVPPGPGGGGGGGPLLQLRFPVPPALADQLRRRLISEDELLAIVCASALPLILGGGQPRR